MSNSTPNNNNDESFFFKLFKGGNPQKIESIREEILDFFMKTDSDQTGTKQFIINRYFMNDGRIAELVIEINYDNGKWDRFRRTVPTIYQEVKYHCDLIHSHNEYLVKIGTYLKNFDLRLVNLEKTISKRQREDNSNPSPAKKARTQTFDTDNLDASVPQRER